MASPSGHKPTASDPPLSPEERRRHRRVDVALKARVLKADGQEEPCLVVNVSAGGALLKAVNPPQAGEKVVVYIDDMGRFEARVIRSAKHHFAVDYRGRRSKTQRAADGLTYALNNRAMRLDRRAAPRINQDEPTILTFESGETVACEVLDISLTGASIAVDPRPELGALVTVGQMKAKVVRRHEKGVGVIFVGQAAQKMDEVIEGAKTQIDARNPGAALAPSFGKKGVSA